MSNTISFLDQFSVSSGPEPAVGTSDSSEPDNEGFQNTLDSVLSSKASVDESAAKLISDSLPMDQYIEVSAAPISLDLDLNHTLEVDTEVDLVGIEPDIVILEPGNLVPVEEAGFDPLGGPLAQKVFVVEPIDNKGLGLDPVTDASSKSSSEPITAPYEESTIINGNSFSRPFTPILSSSATTHNVHGGSLELNIDQNTELEIPPFTAAKAVEVTGDNPLSLLELNSDIAGEIESSVRDIFSQTDILSGNRNTNSNPDTPYVEGTQINSNPVMTVHKTTAEAHPLIMSPPGATTLKQTIQFMMNDQIPEVEIQLDPPELGSIMVKLKIENGQQAQIVFQSVHPSVRDLLSDHIDRLRETLAETGLDLGSVNVEVGSDRKGSSRESMNQFTNNLNPLSDDEFDITVTQESADKSTARSSTSTNKFTSFHKRACLV